MAEYLYARLNEVLTKDCTLLNLGCGIGRLVPQFKYSSILNVDVWTPYLDQIKFHYPTLRLDIRNLICFVDKSWDNIIMLDVIEHLEKNDALTLLKECDRIARKNVIIYTPIGFYPQEDGLEKSWACNNPEYQKHRCGFSEQEIRDLGFQKIDTFKNIDIPSIYAVKVL